MAHNKLSYTVELDWTKPNRLTWSFVGVIALAIFLGVAVAFGVNKTGILTVLAVFGLIFLIVAVGRPDVSIIGFAFVLYLNLSDILVSQGYPSVAKPFVALLAVILLIRWLVFKDEFKGLSRPFLLIGLYTFFGSISLFFADSFTAAFSTLSVYLKDAIICFLIIALIQDKDTLIRVVRAVLIAGIVMGSISVFQQLTGTFSNNYFGFADVLSDTTYGLRITGPVGDPNFFAQIMVVLLPLAADRFSSEKNLFFKFIAAWAFIICTLTVVFTYSRGAFLAAFVCVILTAYRHRPGPSQIVAAVFAVMIIYQFLPSNYTDRISTLFYFLPGNNAASGNDISFRGRSSENIVAFRMFMDNPITGAGMGNYNSKYQQYSRQLGLDFRAVDRSAHSLYLEILAERGILGVISFFTLLYYTFISLRDAEKFFSKNKMGELSNLTSAMMISLVAYFVTATFLHDALIRYFWLLMGIAWSVPQAMVLEQRFSFERPTFHETQPTS
ncbi:MAG: O-antigen ligase family protein [Anaerolineales bacterium]